MTRLTYTRTSMSKGGVAVRCGAVQCSEVQYCAVQCSAIRYGTVQCSVVQWNMNSCKPHWRKWQGGKQCFRELSRLTLIFTSMIYIICISI